MRAWTTETWLPRPPADVLDLLGDPAAIVSWSPVPFELLDFDAVRLDTGSRARVRGSIAGRHVVFDVRIVEASPERFSLVASGPFQIAARYVLAEEGSGSRVQATIEVAGRGWTGGLLARATEAVLKRGALETVLARIGHQLERDDELAYA